MSKSRAATYETWSPVYHLPYIVYMLVCALYDCIFMKSCSKTKRFPFLILLFPFTIFGFSVDLKTNMSYERSLHIVTSLEISPTKQPCRINSRRVGICSISFSGNRTVPEHATNCTQLIRMKQQSLILSCRMNVNSNFINQNNLKGKAYIIPVMKWSLHGENKSHINKSIYYSRITSTYTLTRVFGNEQIKILEDTCLFPIVILSLCLNFKSNPRKNTLIS